MNKKYGVTLCVDYNRISPDDMTGMIDIGCEGAEEWIYSDIGTHVGMQGESSGVDIRVMQLGAKIAKLVREHFEIKKIIPLQDKPLKKKKNKLSK